LFAKYHENFLKIDETYPKAKCSLERALPFSKMPHHLGRQMILDNTPSKYKLNTLCTYSRPFYTYQLNVGVVQV
jgi:hypothetical protein